MKKNRLFLFILVLAIIASCTTNKYKVKQKTDKNGYAYEIVTNDPLGTRVYTLNNGLKVYMSVNKDQPRIQTFIAVKAGSTYDPPQTTGLAHYLEHLMFKGSSKIGTTNWEQEKVLLSQISDLYEQHLKTDNLTEKKKIYAKIDSISLFAAKYTIASEYNKLVSTIGAKGTNAHTSYERTVYVNDVPSNEFEKWLQIESERFSQLVMRLFHTELETVYEEFNMYQDYDWEKVDNALMGSLFPTHPYGTQTVIGEANHLKNPSMVNIQNYWNTYYVPNNMAFCLSGDLNFENTIQLIDKYWGKFEKKEVPEIKHPKEAPPEKTIIKEVYGPEEESVTFAYRFNGTSSEDEKYVTLIDLLLNNRKAGLIDLDLIQQQKILKGGCGPMFMKDYGVHVFNGNPREGQSLDEVTNLLVAEVEKVKNGEFDNWLIQAVINDMRLGEIYQQESNFRAYQYVNAFVTSKEWIDQVKFIDDLEKITKEQLVEFAKTHYANYVAVFKRTGEDKEKIKIEKPEITGVPMNRDSQSEFFKKISEEPVDRLQPVFIDFKNEIKTATIQPGVEFNYLKNNTNELFQMIYITDMGKNHMAKLPIAVNYLPYIGTNKYPAAELQKELFKYGLTFGVKADNDRVYVYISGLDRSFEKGMELLEHIIADAKPDQKAFTDYIDGILKQRADNKLNKNIILFEGLFNYVKYGKFSPFTNILSEEDLKNTKPEELTDIIKELSNYKHIAFYYGQKKFENAKQLISKYHVIPDQLKDYPEPFSYPELEFNSNKVYIANYDMVQANIALLTKDQLFDKNLIPHIILFNEYYGGSSSSIVFQEIREAKALAYWAFAEYSTPEKQNRSNYIFGFVGTQADKLKIATDAMLELMSNLPESQKSMEASKEAIIKKIETERIIKTNIFWTYLNNLDLGIDYDNRKDVYEFTKNATLQDVSNFFNEHIKNKNYTFLVLGKKESLSMEALNKLGEVEELTLEELFNY